MRIHALPPLVANQIAAGEVIERPASVIKELLENAADASATRIEIEVDFGGLNKIKVSDNGQGIMPDDLPLAIAAHATSKLTTLEDLQKITSLGFRGEALASIAAISKLKLSSKAIGHDQAMMLESTGNGYDIYPCARNQGTSVEVCDLFYNTPVRKIFLKSMKNEFLAIDGMVKRFALSQPKIAISLKHNSKLMFKLPAVTQETTMHLRVKKILGKGFLESAQRLDVVDSHIQLMGWISGLDHQRSQSDKLYIYINDRMVKDKLMHHAIKKAYDNRLYPGRYPSCLLYLNIPPEEVDINVHPTKYEVRFKEPRLIHDFIAKHLTQALESEVKPLPAFSQDKLPFKTALTQCQNPFTPVPILNNTGSASSFIPLNSQFILLSIENKSYLIDYEKAVHSQLSFFLSQASFPLIRRPLLVPVRIRLNQKSLVEIEKSADFFFKYGIEFDLLSREELAVRTIPLPLAQLDIKKLFTCLDDEWPFEEKKFISHLLNSQSTDAQQLSQDDKIIFMEFFQSVLNTKSPLNSWYLRLDHEQCHAILYA